MFGHPPKSIYSQSDCNTTYEHHIAGYSPSLPVELQRTTIHCANLRASHPTQPTTAPLQ